MVSRPPDQLRVERVVSSDVNRKSIRYIAPNKVNKLDQRGSQTFFICPCPKTQPEPAPDSNKKQQDHTPPSRRIDSLSSQLREATGSDSPRSGDPGPRNNAEKPLPHLKNIHEWKHARKTMLDDDPQKKTLHSVTRTKQTDS